MSSSLTLSRLMYAVRSCQPPVAQNLPTLSVVPDRSTSGPLPAPIAWATLSSSCPGLTLTLMAGYFAWKSLTTCWMASASRSVKKCQNSMVPEAVTPGEATCWGFAPGVQPAASRGAEVRHAAAVRLPRRRRFMDGAPLGRGVLRGLSSGDVQVADELLADLGDRGVQRAEQDRVVRETGDGDPGIPRAGQT